MKILNDKTVYIKSFKGLYLPEKYDLTVINSRTNTHRFPEGVVITLINNQNVNADYSKNFKIHFISRNRPINDDTEDQRSFINRCLIMQIYRYREASPQFTNWCVAFNGYILDKDFEDIKKIKDFCIEYAENFKL